MFRDFTREWLTNGVVKNLEKSLKSDVPKVWTAAHFAKLSQANIQDVQPFRMVELS